MKTRTVSMRSCRNRVQPVAVASAPLSSVQAGSLKPADPGSFNGSPPPPCPQEGHDDDDGDNDDDPTTETSKAACPGIVDTPGSSSSLLTSCVLLQPCLQGRAESSSPGRPRTAGAVVVAGGGGLGLTPVTEMLKMQTISSHGPASLTPRRTRTRAVTGAGRTPRRPRPKRQALSTLNAGRISASGVVTSETRRSRGLVGGGGGSNPLVGTADLGALHSDTSREVLVSGGGASLSRDWSVGTLHLSPVDLESSIMNTLMMKTRSFHSVETIFPARRGPSRDGSEEVENEGAHVNNIAAGDSHVVGVKKQDSPDRSSSSPSLDRTSNEDESSDLDATAGSVHSPSASPARRRGNMDDSYIRAQDDALVQTPPVGTPSQQRAVARRLDSPDDGRRKREFPTNNSTIAASHKRRPTLKRSSTIGRLSRSAIQRWRDGAGNDRSTSTSTTTLRGRPLPLMRTRSMRVCGTAAGGTEVTLEAGHTPLPRRRRHPSYEERLIM